VCGLLLLGSAVVQGWDINGNGVPDEDDTTLPMLAPPRMYATATEMNLITTADFDGDGHIDIVTAGTESGEIEVFLNHGDGTFGDARPVSGGAGPTDLQVGDLNGDQRPDIVLLNGTTNKLVALINQGDGTFGTPVLINVAVVVAFRLVDMNHDGNLDLVVGAVPGPAILILLGDGHGNFAAHTLIASSAGNGAIDAGDLNGDGYTDLVVGSGEASPYWELTTVTILLNDGSGAFVAQTLDGGWRGGYPCQAIFPGTVVIADLDGDGRADLLVTVQVSVYRTCGWDRYPVVNVFRGHGDGTFERLAQVGEIVASGRERLLFAFPAIADLDGDGDPDFVLSSRDNSVIVARNDGNLSFTTSTFSHNRYLFAQSVGLADVDEDGLPDAVVAWSHQVADGHEFGIAVLRSALGPYGHDCNNDGLLDEYQPAALVDPDGDGIFVGCDNCPNVYNPDQADRDGDGVGDVCDNCPDKPNLDQRDFDGDGLGDLCDACPADPHNDADHNGVCAVIWGDINGDGCVDVADLGLVVARESSGQAGPNWLPEDLNHDGKVDSVDIGIVTMNLGKCGDGVFEAPPESEASQPADSADSALSPQCGSSTCGSGSVVSIALTAVGILGLKYRRFR
jgi:hypothetical protein